MSLYIWLGKIAYYIAYPLLRTFSTSLAHPRVRIQVTDDRGRILLVRTWFGRQRWSLPGGGIARHETSEQAAVRELYEETMISINADQLQHIGEMKGVDGLPFHLILFKVQLDTQDLQPLPLMSRLEIVGRQWWPVDDLPADISPAVTRSLKSIV